MLTLLSWFSYTMNRTQIPALLLICVSGKTCVPSTYNLPKSTLVRQSSHPVSTNVSVCCVSSYFLLPSKYPTYISQLQVNDFSCYIKMNVVQMSMSFQAVLISVYHPVFTPSICGVHQHYTTSCRDSCRVLKTGKHWSEVFGTVLDFCWMKLPYGYSRSLWVFLLGEFNTSISNYFNARLISLIITAGYIYIRS